MNDWTQYIFSNREISLIIWTCIFFGGVIFFLSSSKEFRSLLKAFFVKSILLVFLSLFVYLALLALGFYSIGCWNLKDFVLWVFAVPIVQVLTLNKAEETSHFSSIIKKSIGLTVLFEFFVNFYSFSLGWELVLVPAATFIGLVHVVAGTKEEYSPAKKMLEFLLGILGWGVFCYSLYKTIITPEQFFTQATLKAFSFPILLTLFYLPFLYFLALYMAYEEYFVYLEFQFAYQQKYIELKKEIRKLAKLNLDKLNRIRKNIDKRIVYDTEDLRGYLKRISEKS